MKAHLDNETKLVTFESESDDDQFLIGRLVEITGRSSTVRYPGGGKTNRTIDLSVADILNTFLKNRPS